MRPFLPSLFRVALERDQRLQLYGFAPAFLFEFFVKFIDEAFAVGSYGFGIVKVFAGHQIDQVIVTFDVIQKRRFQRDAFGFQGFQDFSTIFVQKTLPVPDGLQAVRGQFDTNAACF